MLMQVPPCNICGSAEDVDTVYINTYGVWKPEFVCLKCRFQVIIDNSKDLEPDIVEMVNEDFWDLLA